MPRILSLIDEFQVMFTDVPPKSVSVITDRITSLSKLARSCGCHLWFTSQSMANTLPRDILSQFSLRIALNCSRDTQKTIIGADNLVYKTKVGWAYSNEQGGESQSTTKLWRVPFASNAVITSTIETVNKLCAERKSVKREAPFYDEKRRHSSAELISLYREHDGFAEHPGLIVLGERTAFSLNRAPVNFQLTADDGEHVFALAPDREDLLNVCLSAAENVRCKPCAELIIHCADKDTHTMLGVSELLRTPELEPMSKPDFPFADWLDGLEQMLAARKEIPADELSPVFFLAVQWEKYRGYGRDGKAASEERLRLFLQDAAAVKLHFIFVSRTLTDLPRPTYQSCNHCVCCKSSDAESDRIVGSTCAALFKENGFGAYSRNGVVQKFKLYQHTFKRQIEASEITL
jgi:hypothetical protein